MHWLESCLGRNVCNERYFSYKKRESDTFGSLLICVSKLSQSFDGLGFFVLLESSKQKKCVEGFPFDTFWIHLHGRIKLFNGKIISNVLRIMMKRNRVLHI